jgi:hypothetical protein
LRLGPDIRLRKLVAQFPSFDPGADGQQHGSDLKFRLARIRPIGAGRNRFISDRNASAILHPRTAGSRQSICHRWAYRWGNTWPTWCATVCSKCRAPQEGAEPLARQLEASSLSWRKSSQRRRRNRSAPDTFIGSSPNAALPNPMSDTGFDETPEVPLRQFGELTEQGRVNIVGRVLRHASGTYRGGGAGAAGKTAGARPVLSGSGVNLLHPQRFSKIKLAQIAQAYITDLNLFSYV